MIARSVVLDSPEAADKLREVVNQLASRGQLQRVPDDLRRKDVSAITISIAADGSFRVIPEGLRNSWRPHVDVEGRGKIVADHGQTKVRFEVGLDPSSRALLVTAPTVLIGLAVYNLLAEGASQLSFWGLCGFAALLAGFLVLQARGQVARAWPGLLEVARRVAAGPRVPAA